MLNLILYEYFCAVDDLRERREPSNSSVLPLSKEIIYVWQNMRVSRLLAAKPEEAACNRRGTISHH